MERKEPASVRLEKIYKTQVLTWSASFINLLNMNRFTWDGGIHKETESQLNLQLNIENINNIQQFEMADIRDFKQWSTSK